MKLKKKLKNWKISSRGYGTVFDLYKKKKEIAKLKKKSEQVDFWNNQGNASAIMRRLEQLRGDVESVDNLEKEISDLTELIELSEEEKKLKSSTTKLNFTVELADLRKHFTELELKTLFDGKYDESDVIMTIRSGAGGTDAQDWAEILLRMYLHWAENKKFKTKILDKSAGSEAGIKNVILEISGELVYGYLRSEIGSHRLVRLSPFNSDNLRQTSFAVVEILPIVKNKTEIEIVESDLRIDTFRSSGAGGQSVNTTDSAVRITHLPSNLVVTCQNERSQLQNKEAALKILRAKLQQQKIDEVKKKEAELRGERSSAEWGSQIRSYVLHPYKLVKDHRTKYEENDPSKVLEGNIDSFIWSFLKK